MTPYYTMNTNNVTRRKIQTHLDALWKKHGVHPMDILSRNKAREFSVPRQELYLRLWSSGLGVAKIGRALGVDHTTVLHGARKAAELALMEKDDE